MNEQSKATDEAETTSQNMSFEEFVASRTAKFSEPEEPEEETEEIEETEEADDELEQSDDFEETEESEETEEEPEETEEEEDHEIDLLSLTPEQIQQLARTGKSRLLKRFGELTAKAHALEQKLADQAEAKPLPKPIPSAENPFRDLKTVEDIQAKYQELEKVAEDTDRILEDHEDYGADDIITLGDREFTKKQVRLANRNARDAMLKFLPAQHAEIQKSGHLSELAARYEAAIPVEIPELAQEDSELSKQYKAMMDDPLIEQIRDRVPEMAPQIGYLVAHALRNISRSKNSKTSKPATVIKGQAKVPSSPIGAGAARTGKSSVKKSVQEKYKQFEETGSEEAWIAARIAQKTS